MTDTKNASSIRILHKGTRKSILRLVVSFQDTFLCRQREFRLFRLFRRIIRLYQSWQGFFDPAVRRIRAFFDVFKALAAGTRDESVRAAAARIDTSGCFFSAFP